VSIVVVSKVMCRQFPDYVPAPDEQDALLKVGVSRHALKLIAWVLADGANDDGTGTWPGLDRISTCSQLSRAQSRRWLAALQRPGYTRFVARARRGYVGVDDRGTEWALILEKLTPSSARPDAHSDDGEGARLDAHSGTAQGARGDVQGARLTRPEPSLEPNARARSNQSARHAHPATTAPAPSEVSPLGDTSADERATVFAELRELYADVTLRPRELDDALSDLDRIPVDVLRRALVDVRSRKLYPRQLAERAHAMLAEDRSRRIDTLIAASPPDPRCVRCQGRGWFSNGQGGKQVCKCVAPTPLDGLDPAVLAALGGVTPNGKDHDA